MAVDLSGLGSHCRLTNVVKFMASTREGVNIAVTSNIIGLYDTGNFQIGNSLYTGRKDAKLEKLLQFTLELFVHVTSENAMKQRLFHKKINQLEKGGSFYGLYSWCHWSTTV